MNNTEIAVEIGEVQCGLATGELTALSAQEVLNNIKRKIIKSGDGREIVEGYRRDAVGHLMQVRTLLSEHDLHTLPDSALLHISALCELSSYHIRHYFDLRNQVAARGVVVNNPSVSKEEADDMAIDIEKISRRSQ